MSECSGLWRTGQKLPGLINHNSSCFSRMHRPECMKQTNNKTFIQVSYLWHTPICRNLSGSSFFFFFSFLQKLILLLLRQKSFRLSLLQRGVPVPLSRMGHLIKIGIRRSLWQDLFPGWGNCALRGRLPTSAETVIPWITFTLSAEYHLIETCRRRFLFPELLIFHFGCLSLLSFTSDICRSGTCYLLSALNMPRMCCEANF